MFDPPASASTKMGAAEPLRGVAPTEHRDGLRGSLGLDLRAVSPILA